MARTTSPADLPPIPANFLRRMIGREAYHRRMADVAVNSGSREEHARTADLMSDMITAYEAPADRPLAPSCRSGGLFVVAAAYIKDEVILGQRFVDNQQCVGVYPAVDSPAAMVEFMTHYGQLYPGHRIDGMPRTFDASALARDFVREYG